MKRKRQKDDVIFLRARRLYLRPARRSDIPLFVRWMNDPEIRQFIKRDMPLSEMEEEEWFGKHTKDKNNVFLVICLTSGRIIGTMGIHRINWKDRTATTGAVIGEKDCWDRGYGQEAKMALLEYAFNTLNLRKICSTVFAFNTRSIAYSKKCGYKVEGVLKAHNFVGGEYVDRVHLAVFREDWLALRTKLQRKGNTK